MNLEDLKRGPWHSETCGCQVRMFTDIMKPSAGDVALACERVHDDGKRVSVPLHKEGARIVCSEGTPRRAGSLRFAVVTQACEGHQELAGAALRAQLMRRPCGCSCVVLVREGHGLVFGHRLQPCEEHTEADIAAWLPVPS